MEAVGPDGTVRPDERVAPWLAVVAGTAARLAEGAPDGVLVEAKGPAVAVHWRAAPDAGPWAMSRTAEEAARSGLEAHPGRLSVELRPPLAIDKGTVVRQLTEGCGAACFLGDDLGDLPAFAELARRSAEDGLATVGVAVRDAETAPEVADAADLAVDGPEGALAVLRWLEAATTAGRCRLTVGRRRAAAAQRAAASWSSSQSTGRRASTASRSVRARVARSSAPQASARASTVAVSVTSNGLISRAPADQPVERAGLAGQGQHPVAGVDQRALHGHQVEPVAHRIDQEHVVAGERGQRPGVVVLDLEDDRRPTRGAPPLVDALHRGLHLVLVGEVFRQALAGRVGEGDEDDPPAVLRFALEQLVEGPEPAQQVLRQLHPVDAHDHLPVGASDGVLDAGERGGDVRPRRRRPEAVGVGRQGPHERRCVGGGQTGRGQSGAEGRGPALGVEPAGAEPGHGGQEFVAHGGGEHPQDRRVGERGVGEVGGGQVRTQVGQGRGHEGQVVVLDQHPAPLRRHLGHPLGHEAVVGAVGVPGLHPPAVGAGPAGRVEQVVVAEPQRGVRDHVVGQVVDVRLGLDQFDAQSVGGHQTLGRGQPVGLVHRGGDPGGARARHERVERARQPASGRRGDGTAVLHPEGQGATVGDQDEVGQRPIGRAHARDATPSYRGHPAFRPGRSRPVVGHLTGSE